MSYTHQLLLTAESVDHVCEMCVGASADRLSFSEVSGRLYYTDRQSGSINVIDPQQYNSVPRPIITGLDNPLPITAHPQYRYTYTPGWRYTIR